jgi:hypothetical protein
MPLPSHLRKYFDAFDSAALAVFLDGPYDLYDLAAICDRESCGGLTLRPKGPAGTGDGGHGHGLMQIDDRSYPEFCSGEEWKDPTLNILKGAMVLHEKWTEVRDHQGGIAAYNCGARNVLKARAAGLDVDRFTTGRNYSADVMARAARFRGVES